MGNSYPVVVGGKQEDALGKALTREQEIFAEWAVLKGLPKKYWLTALTRYFDRLLEWAEEWGLIFDVEDEKTGEVLTAIDVGTRVSVFAQQLGYDQSTLYRWFKDKAVQAKVAEIEGTVKAMGVSGAMVAGAITASIPGKDGVQDRKLLYEMSGKLGGQGEAQVVEHKHTHEIHAAAGMPGKSARQMTEDEMRKAHEAIVRRKHPDFTDAEVKGRVDEMMEIMSGGGPVVRIGPGNVKAGPR